MCVQYFIFTGKMEVEGVSGWRSALFVSCKLDDFKNWYLLLSCQRKEKQHSEAGNCLWILNCLVLVELLLYKCSS